MILVRIDIVFIIGIVGFIIGAALGHYYCERDGWYKGYEAGKRAGLEKAGDI